MPTILFVQEDLMQPDLVHFLIQASKGTSWESTNK